ncbi:hypothetical protein EKG40_11315 [Pseudomonas moorei]|nr:hypothetical protein EKG40_11315 [Pseudomonas moorei]
MASKAPKPRTIPVGASLLAMDVHENAGSQTPRGVLKSIASKFVPTEAFAVQANAASKSSSSAFWASPGTRAR